MKNAILGIILMTILIFTCATLYGLEGKTTRQNELDANLGAAMKGTIKMMTIDTFYAIDKNDDHMVADFIQNYLVKTNSNSKFEIDILAADAEKGLLSVKVTEKYQSLFTESSVSATRTVIHDTYEKEEEEYFKVTFYQDYDEATGKYENPFKQIYVYGGSNLADFTVLEPVRKDYIFSGWELRDSDGTKLEFNGFEDVVVMGDVYFNATWQPAPEGE